MTPGLSWFRSRRPYIQQKGRHYITCTGVLVVGGTSLSERGRGAPKSLDVLGVIEASANIGWSDSVCSRRRYSMWPMQVLLLIL